MWEPAFKATGRNNVPAEIGTTDWQSIVLVKTYLKVTKKHPHSMLRVNRAWNVV